ncbi:unnamed protein product [Ectocarpus sp. 8 AP-2014]
MRRRTTSHTPRRMPVALKNSGRAAPNNGRSSSSSNKNKHSGRRHGAGAKSSRSKGDESWAAVDMDVDAQRCRKHRRRPRSLLEMHSPHAVRDEESGGEDEAGKGRTPRWLETHIWHAKRMRMKHTWGFVLPAESNRGPRAAVEAALKHCTLQDLTFMRPLELRGPRWCILGALSAVTDPLDSRPKQQSCVDGFVEARTHLYRTNEFPLGCVAPVTVLWAPSDSAATANDEDAGTNDHDTDGNNGTSAPEAGGDGGGGGRATEGREEGGTGGASDGLEERQKDVRLVWVWVHPAAAKEALREIRKACDLEGSPWQGCVQAGPVPGGLCRLRVRGARSHETVQRVLRTAAATAEKGAPAAAAGDDYEGAARENAGHWRALGASPAKSCGGGNNNNEIPRQIPSGSVLAITALDPRQQRKNGNVRSSCQGRDSGGCRNSEGMRSSSSGQDPGMVGSRDSQRAAPAAAAAAAVEQWPPRVAAVSPLWDPDARALAAPLPDHVINEHRRRERARESWHGEQSTAAGKDTGSPGEECVGGGGGTPVILVSASGFPTTAHGQSAAPTAKASRFSGDRGSDGGGGSGGGKEAERKRQALAAGWDIVLSPGWAPVFFGALVMAGARAISLEDADGLMLEAGEPRFPADFPDTASGRRHWDEVGRQAEEAWKRTRPKHRGFKRPALSPPPEAPSLPPPQSECGEGVTATVGDGSGATAGSDETAEKAEGDEGQQEEGQQQRQNLAPKPSSLPLRWFRPDFRSLAGAGGTPSTRAESAERNGDVGDGDGSAAADASVVAWKPQQEREPYAVARGFQYVRAFLPDVEEEHRETDSCDEDDDVDGGNRLSLDLRSPPPPPPLRLALPTVLELVIVLDKGAPKAGAPLHAASPKHHALWMQGRRNGKPWPGLSAKDALLAAVGSPCGDLPATAAIGAVTSGGVSYLRGVGVGRGVCEAVTVRDALLASLFSCRQRRGSGGGGGGGTRQWGQQRRAWALLLVGNEAGDWFRPAEAIVADT